MLSLSRGDGVYLTATRWQGARVLASNAEQDQFGDVAKVKTDSTPVRATVLSDLLPDDVAFVGKAPRSHDCEPLWQ